MLRAEFVFDRVVKNLIVGHVNKQLFDAATRTDTLNENARMRTLAGKKRKVL